MTASGASFPGRRELAPGLAPDRSCSRHLDSHGCGGLQARRHARGAWFSIVGPPRLRKSRPRHRRRHGPRRRDPRRRCHRLPPERARALSDFPPRRPRMANRGIRRHRPANIAADARAPRPRPRPVRMRRSAGREPPRARPPGERRRSSRRGSGHHRARAHQVLRRLPRVSPHHHQRRSRGVRRRGVGQGQGLREELDLPRRGQEARRCVRGRRSRTPGGALARECPHSAEIHLRYRDQPIVYRGERYPDRREAIVYGIADAIDRAVRIERWIGTPSERQALLEAGRL